MLKTTCYTALLAISILAAAQTPLSRDSAALERAGLTARVIAVDGSATVHLTPDIARISVGVQTESPSAAEAVSSNNRRAGDILDALAALGVRPEELRTTNFQIYPRQNYDTQGRPTNITYQVNNSVNAVLRNLDQLGSLLENVIAAGATTVGGIQFDVADRETPYNRALELAVAHARQRAQLIAEAQGVRLGPVQSVVAGGGGTTYAGGELRADLTSVAIAPGQTEITVTVSAVYEIQ